MIRDLDINIRAASEHGFVVTEAGEIIAGISTAAELARWVEAKASGGEVMPQISGESEPITLPNVVQNKRGLWGGRQ